MAHRDCIAINHFNYRLKIYTSTKSVAWHIKDFKKNLIKNIVYAIVRASGNFCTLPINYNVFGVKILLLVEMKYDLSP